MFDSFFGLPLHVFVLHFTVVLLPIGASATIAVMLRPAWRARFAQYVAGGNVGLFVLTFITLRSGYALQTDLGGGVPVNDHEALAETLLWIMLALAVLSVTTWLGTRTGGMAPTVLTGLGVTVALVAAVSIGFTIATGHTGSNSHWGFLEP